MPTRGGGWARFLYVNFVSDNTDKRKSDTANCNYCQCTTNNKYHVEYSSFNENISKLCNQCKNTMRSRH